MSAKARIIKGETFETLFGGVKDKGYGNESVARHMLVEYIGEPDREPRHGGL